MRRLLAIGAVAGLMISAYALAHTPTAAYAASSSNNLTLAAAPNSQGCALGPAFTFCDQNPGTGGSPLSFTIQSSADVTGVTVAVAAVPGLSANFAAGDFSLAGNTCTGNLAANQTCEIDIAFSPTAAGIRQAQVTVSDAQSDSLTFNIEGTGNNLAISSTPGALTVGQDNAFTFPGQTVGTASAPQIVTITAGTAVSGIAVSIAATPGLESEFASSDFTITGNACGALAAGASCTVNVEFTPASVGLRAASLIATDSQGDSTTFYFAGYGSNGHGGNQAGGLSLVSATANPSAESCARVNEFGFCNLPAGGIALDTKTFALENVSGAQVTGLSVPTGSVIAQGATAPDFAVQTSSCSSVLAAGATCNLTVAFTPTKSGLRQGTIAISDALGDIAAVNLAGVGDDYSITPQLPTEVSVIPGATATYDATLTPDNVLGMNGEQVTFVCPTNLPTNTSCAVTPCPATITPGSPVSLKVTVVTSSALVVAPIPSTACSGYGPSLGLIGPPPVERPGGPVNSYGSTRSSPLYPALLGLASAVAIGLLLVAFAAPEYVRSRNRVPLLFASAALAAALLTGCHHHGTVVTSATPTGVTNLKLLGSALDVNGNSLNTSRSFQVTLDVVTN